MLLQHIFITTLTEAINAPYAFDVYQIIEECAAHSKTAEDFRTQLNTHLTAFFRAKLAETEVHRRGLTLDVYIAEPAGNYHGGGVFRSYDMDINIADNNGLLSDGLPAVPDKTLEIWVFVEDDRLKGILEKWHNYTDAIQMIGATLIHEFIHVVQHCRRKNDPNATASLNRYTVDIARDKKDDKRFGKRGKYISPDVNPQAYYGTSIEVEAHAATAAAEVIHRVRRESPDDQRAYLEKTLRSLRDNSPTLMNYREKFNKSMLFFGAKSDPKKSAQIKRQKALVWKLFRMKLAKHLIDYMKSLSSRDDDITESDLNGRSIRKIANEDASADQAAFAKAESIRSALIRYLLHANPDDHYGFKGHRFADGEVMLCLRGDQIGLNGEDASLWFRFGEQQGYAASGHIAKFQKSGQTAITIFCLKDIHDTEAAAKTIIYSNPVHNVLIHELTHYLDAARNPTMHTKGTGEDKQGKTDYYNDPVEFNAFFTNLADPLLTILSLDKTDARKVVRFAKGLGISRDFKETLSALIQRAAGQPSPALKRYWEHLLPNRRKRVIRRLHALHRQVISLLDADEEKPPSI